MKAAFIWPTLLLVVLCSGATAKDSCELERILGGDSAYRDCLVRQSGDGTAPTRPNGPASQPMWPAQISPVKTLPTAPVVQSTVRSKYALDDLFNRVKDSVFVVVAAKDDAAVRREDFSQGSAVAISTNRLWTNCHVVDGNRYIALYQEEEIFTVNLVWRDVKTDRCVLEVDDLHLRPVAAIRDFGSLKVGERVYTVGAPYGLEHTLGEGLVSGKRNRHGVNLIQTSAPIASGSSGGGLFDEQAQLIGITTFLIRDTQALNFAIAADAFPR